MTLPKILYKYCSPCGIAILEGGSIWFTRRERLNDVFEMTPIVNFDDALYIAAQEQLRSDNSAILLHLDAPTQHNSEGIVADTLDCAFCLCLADARDNALMWSYYTAGHTGFVIGFDTTNHHLFPEPPKPVSYSETRPEVAFGKSFHDSVYTKADYWSHEREWRAMQVLEDYPNPNHPVSFPPAAVKEIILGNRMSDSCRKRVLTCTQGLDYAHVQIFNAEPHRKNWSLQRIQI